MSKENFKEHVALARMLLKKKKCLSPPFLMRHFKVSHDYAKKLIQAVVKEAFSNKKIAKKQDRKMSSYELKAHQRLKEVEIAQNLLNIIERSQRQGMGCKEQLEQITYELQLITKKPIVPVAQLEED